MTDQPTKPPFVSEAIVINDYLVRCPSCGYETRPEVVKVSFIKQIVTVRFCCSRCSTKWNQEYKPAQATAADITNDNALFDLSKF